MAGDARRKVCVFCDVDLTRENRSNEHVIRKAWLRAFGYLDAEIRAVQSSGLTQLAVRVFQASGFVAGEVCRSCNNGWMERLDGEAQGVVLLMAMGRLHPRALTRPVRKLVAWWALKTIFAFGMTDAVGRRHIPAEYRFKLRAGMLPPGSISIQACIRPMEALGVSIVDAWPSNDSSSFILGRPQSRRLKFGISFGHMVLAGSCLFDAAHVRYRAHRDWHVPVYEQGAENVFVELDPKQTCSELGWNHALVEPHDLSAALLQPDVLWPAEAVLSELFPKVR